MYALWKRRIKPTRRYTSLGLTQIVHISEGMCRQCAWEKIKLKCKICGKIIAKRYPRLLARITAHYTTAELLSNFLKTSMKAICWYQDGYQICIIILKDVRSAGFEPAHEPHFWSQGWINQFFYIIIKFSMH
jgi:DNA-directed RNA polymerase subunit N (RpoN/RPB10)